MCCLYFSAVHTTSQTATRNAFMRFDLTTAAADLTCDAPTPTPDGEFAVLVVGPNSGYKLTVQTSGGAKLVQPTSTTATTLDLITDGETAFFQSDGTDWYLVG